MNSIFIIINDYCRRYAAYTISIKITMLYTCGTPSSRAASTKLSRSWRRDPAERTWQLTKSAKKRTKYLDSSHLALFRFSFNVRSSNSTHWRKNVKFIIYNQDIIFLFSSSNKHVILLANVNVTTTSKSNMNIMLVHKSNLFNFLMQLLIILLFSYF